MKIASFTIAVSALVLAIATTGAVADETIYYFGISDQRTNITFESHADFEVTVGSTNKLSGTTKVDWDKGTGSVSLEVPVASLDTGIDLRNEHLRSEMWLDAAKYPTITFETTSARRVSENQWEVAGKLTMHGQTNELTTRVDVKRIPADVASNAGLEAGQWIKVRTEFSVKLSDYGVNVPNKLTGKVDDTWNVTVVAFASTVKKG